MSLQRNLHGTISLGERRSWRKGSGWRGVGGGGVGSSASVWSLSYRASICHPAIRPSYPSLAGGVVQPGICKNTQRKWSLWARQE